MEKPARGKYPSVKTVTHAERVGMVKEIFSTITSRYDFLNHFLSFGFDIGWRRFAVRKMRFFRTMRFLDVACGTGDLSLDAAKHQPAIRIDGIDFVPEMVLAAQVKLQDKGLTDRIAFLQGDALAIPFPDNAFDVAAIAFGIRNIPDRLKALEEMRRVVVPGGQVMVLEMTFIRRGPLRFPYYCYLNYLLPLMASLVSSNPAAYHYLADSIMNFPDPEAFARLMGQAGLKNVIVHPLTFGATCLHIGHKAEGSVNE
jgi:demethylmenaquinone methyltransferase / 2-methoxy-6-polyprenyl-1,4-benzoquinol methylase